MALFLRKSNPNFCVHGFKPLAYVHELFVGLEPDVDDRRSDCDFSWGGERFSVVVWPFFVASNTTPPVHPPAKMRPK